MKLHSKVKGNGNPLIILHGFLGMGDNWKTLANSYAKEGFEVHLLDQRNHGRSPHDEAFNYELLAEDLKAYLKEKDIKSASIIGHSMGGKTAMRFATLYPEQVDNLIIVDIAPKYYPPHHQEILEGLNAVSKAKLSSRTDADDLLANYIKELPVRQFLLKNLYWKTQNEMALRMNLEALQSNILEIGKALPLGATYPKETLFIRGGRSGYIKDSDKSQIEKHFENYRIETVANAGHWIHAEKREEFYDLSLEFLKKE